MARFELWVLGLELCRSGRSILSRGSSGRNSSLLATDLGAVCGATEERRRGEDPMFVLNGDLPEGGGRDDFVLRSSFRLFGACAASTIGSTTGQNTGALTERYVV
jgi:hypothetical protein